MTIRDITDLKAFFETGDRPTQDQFSDLIDSAIQTTSIFGRYGTIIGVSGDYTTNMITDTSSKVMMTSTERAILTQIIHIVNDGSSNYDSVVQTALTSIASSGGVIEFGPGEFNFTTALSGTFSKSIIIRGCAPRATRLVWAASGTVGINITFTDKLEIPEIHNLSLETKQFASGTALTINGPISASTTNIGPILVDITIRGYDMTVDCWLYGIRLNNIWNLMCQRLAVKGLESATIPFDTLYAVDMIDCQASLFTDMHAYHVDTVIRNAGSAAIGGEGSQIANFNFVGVSNGIVCERPFQTSGLFINNGHINAYVRGIECTFMRQVLIHDLEIFKTHLSSNNWQGIQLLSCDEGIVHDILFSCPGVTDTAGQSYGITMSDCAHNTISNINFTHWFPAAQPAIIVNSSSQDNDFTNIRRPNSENNIATLIQFDADAASNNRCFNVFPVARVALSANTATPSVANSVNNKYQTSNSVGTIITGFIGGYDTQTFDLLINDTKTTFSHNAALILKGAISVGTSANNSGFMTFTYDQAIPCWREVSRGF